MILSLIPWRTASGFSLRIYKEFPIRYYGKPEAEIYSFNGQKIALALLDMYSKKKILTAFNPEHSLRMAVVVVIPDGVAGRLLRALSALRSLDPRILRRKIFEELTEEVTLEKLEQALSIQKLIDG